MHCEIKDIGAARQYKAYGSCGFWELMSRCRVMLTCAYLVENETLLCYAASFEEGSASGPLPKSNTRNHAFTYSVHHVMNPRTIVSIAVQVWSP